MGYEVAPGTLCAILQSGIRQLLGMFRSAFSKSEEPSGYRQC